GAGHQSAVIAPVEAHPWPGLPWLVLHMRGLVETFVVIDAKRGERCPECSCGNRTGAADLGREEARSHARKDHQGGDSVEVGYAHTSREPGNLGVVPLNRESDGSASQ